MGLGSKIKEGWNNAKAQQEADQARKQAGGFKTKAAYLGGHPEAAVKAHVGELVLDEHVLSWTGQYREGFDMGFRGSEASFSIDVETIESVEYKGENDLTNAPKGYWVPLPLPWLPGYGSKMKHPVTGGKLTQLLLVRYRDKHGDEQAVGFANHGTFGVMGEVGGRGAEAATKIVGARYRRKEQASS